MAAVVAVPRQECLILRTLAEACLDHKDSEDGVQ